MTELYLHHLWRRKRLPFGKLFLTDGRLLLIHDPGKHNEQLAGPDFELGSITLEGVRLYGHIELHVKSSDWYRHGHQHDPAYENVILHVVHEDDQPLVINGETIPTLELKNLIDPAHLRRFEQRRWKFEDFPCKTSLIELASPYFENMKAKALYDLMQTRAELLSAVAHRDRFGVLYQSLASSFGMAVNKHGFERLTKRVPFYALKGLSARNKYQLLLVESGIWQESQASNHQDLRLWNYRGARPANFPNVRVQQFAHFASRYDFNTSFLYLSVPQITDYFRSLIHDLWSHQAESVPKLSKGFVNHLLINSIVPFMWYCAQEYEDQDLVDKAFELLVTLPPEQNAYVKKWKEVGVKAGSAYDSQAMLALFRDYCSRKKCLSCEVGNKVLNRIA